MEIYQIESWINNQEIAAANYEKVYDPGRLTDVVGWVAQADEKDVDLAVKLANDAFVYWKDMKVEGRTKLLLEAAERIEKSIEHYAALLTRESGMLLSLSIREIHSAIEVIKETVKLAEDFFIADRTQDDKTWIKIEKVPLGVVAALTPWNAPISAAINKVAPIIITGNTVVVKPSPYAPITISLILKEMASLLPDGVVNVVNGDAKAGQILTTHPFVRKVSLTGGNETAIQVMKSAANSLKRVHFELGGNDPAIILEDANLYDAIPQIVESAFRRSGQVCVATKRIYIPKSLYSRACELFIDYVNHFKVGHGLHEEVTFGPVNNSNQFHYVRGIIERAKAYSTVKELGTKMEPDNWENGYYILPTIAMNVKEHHEIVSCEQFGPVVPLIAYKNESEAVEMANNSEYGLGSTVWTGDFEKGLRMANQLETGMTGINGSIVTNLGMRQVPFGGVKQSGIGWERGEFGLEEFVNYHVITYHKNTSLQGQSK